MQQRNCQELPSALERMDRIRRQAAGRSYAVFLDYDGTLTPIVERPEMARLSDEMRRTVERLAQHTQVAVISGRDLRDVQKLVGIESIFYAGSHGFEIEGPRGWHLDSKQVTEFVPFLDSAERDLRTELSGIDGALVERKHFSVATHYRLVSEDQVALVTGAVTKVSASYPRLRRTTGKKVYELQPGLDWHKGKAVRWLLEALELDTKNVLPIFLGDDITDEDAFQALWQDGVGIIVRDEPRPTAARFALDSTEEVGRFLGQLIPQVSD